MTNSDQQQMSRLELECLASPLLRTLLDAVHEAVLIVDVEMRVVLANRIAREIFVFPSEKCLRLIDITRNREIYNCFTQALREECRFEQRIILHSGGRERSLDLRIESITTQEESQKTVIGAVGALYDKTKLELLERTRHEFFANLSHELRTPLTSILSYVETLLSGALYDQDNNVKFLEVIAKHATRMQNLAQDISDLAAVESGKVSMQPRQVRLVDIVREVLELLKDAIANKEAHFELEVDDQFQIWADPKGLEQILFNLVQNAVRFNKPGGLIKVWAHVEPGYHVITVQDTGIGIEAKHIPRIFERLYRVDESRSRKEGGTGLGLAIVKHLVQAHGGSLSVESTPNQGSKFFVYLPIYQLNFSRSH
jgi:two-component system, OmpR family, phosphate regulon sensor histidine kinase PhoR